MSSQNDRPLLGRLFRSRRVVATKSRRGLRPTLDLLEDRLVMTNSPIAVTSLADTLSPGTLRSAIQQANSQAGGNEIDLTVSGTYSLTNGALAIQSTGDNLVIKNTSGAGVAIDGGQTDRVFDINPAATTTGFDVTIQGVTIQNGNAKSSDPVAGSGGGIRAQGAVAIYLDSDTLLSNQAGANGGGIALVNVVNGALVITNTQILTNVATLDGGGVYTGTPGSGSSAPGASTTLTNVLVQNNSARSGGGVEDPGSSLLEVQYATFDGNRALGNGSGGNGGAVDMTNPTNTANGILAEFRNTLFTNNSAFSGSSPVIANTGNGGALNHATGYVNIFDSEFENDKAAGGGGAILSSGRGIAISRVTFTGNQSGAALGANSPNSVPGSGGALYFAGTLVNTNGNGSSIFNSTFTQNTATGNGGAIIDAGPGDLTLVNDTINANTSTQAGGGVALLGTSGSGPLSVLDTILYGNTAGSTGPDVATLNGSSVTDLKGNLVGTLNNGNTGFNSSTLTANPILGPLTDNGGGLAGVNPPLNNNNYRQAILTEALSNKSPAIGTGIALATPYMNSQDGRAFNRPSGGNTNPSIGAYEPQFTVAPSVPFVIGTDSQVYYQSFDPATERPTGTFIATGLTNVSYVSATRFGPASLSFEVFAISGNSVIAKTINSRGVISSTINVSFPVAIASISAGTDANGNPLLFAIGTNQTLYEEQFNAAGQPTGSPTTGPAAYGAFKLVYLTHDASGNPLMFCAGTDGQAYGLLLGPDGTPKGSTNGSTVPLEKLSFGPVNQVLVSHLTNNTPVLFVVGTDSYIYEYLLNPDGSTSGVRGYTPAVSNGHAIGPVKSLSATSTTDVNNAPVIFAVGTDSNVYRLNLNGSTGQPSGSLVQTGTALGGTAAIYAGEGLAAVTSTSQNAPLVFALSLAPDSQLYTQQFDVTGTTSSGGFTILGNGGKVKQSTSGTVPPGTVSLA